MASQLDTQRQINAILKERTGVLQEHSDILSAQVTQAAALQKAWEGASPKEIVDHVEQLNAALNEAQKKFTESGDAGTVSNTKVSKSLEKTNSKIKIVAKSIDEIAKRHWPAATAGFFGFVNGVVKGMSFVKELLTSTTSLIATIAEGFVDIAISIAAMPFRALDGLVAVASKLAGLMQEIATATEEVRKQFGDLAKGPSQAVLESAKNVGKQWESVGLGGYRIFGNLAERIRYVNELGTEMGATFESFAKELLKDSGAVLLMQKGLGLTSEHMKGLAERAAATGSTLTAEMQEMTLFSRSFGKAFGISAKLISRDMGMMIKDVKNFANMSQKDLAKVSVYARSLKVDVSDLLGVVEKFDTFEDAATSAAMLSQAFGVQVDAIKLMNAESPADRVDELRKAFLSTGQSAEKLNRQELRYLSSITGLSEETARAAFSQKNLGVSMQKLNAQGAITEKKQLSTAQAVELLNSSIERMIKAFRTFTSFFQAFTDGFARGVFQAEGMRELLTELYKALAQTYRIGIAVGDAFVKVFPGVKEVTGALRDLFSIDEKKGGRFNVLLNGVKESFGNLFESLKAGNGKYSVKDFMNSLEGNFFAWLNKDDKGRALYDAVKTFSSSIGNVIGQFIDVVTEGIEKGVKVLIDLMDGKGIPNMKGDGIIARFLNPIIDAFSRNADRIAAAFKTLLEKAWEKAKPMLLDVGGKILPWVVGIIVGPAVVQGLITGGIAKIAGVIGKMITGAFAKVKGGGEIEKAKETMSVATEISEGVSTFAKSAKEIGVAQIVKLAAGLALAITAIGAGIAATTLMIGKIEKLGGMPSFESIAKFAAIAAAVAGAALIFVPSAIIAGKLDWKTVVKGFLGIAAGMTIMAGAIGVILGIVSLVAKLGIPANISDILGAVGELFVVSALLVAPAIALGAALSVPGVAVLGAVGFAALGVIANGLVAAVIPAIRMIAGVSIPSPENFKMVSDVIIKIMNITSDFTRSIGTIVSTLADIDDKKFEESMKSVTGFVNSILKTGFNLVIQKIIDVAQLFEGKEDKLQSVSVIADVISAVSNLVTSFASVISAIPDEGFFKSLLKTSTTFGSKMDDARIFFEGIMLSIKDDLVPTINKLLSIEIADSSKAHEKLSVLSSALGMVTSVFDVIKAHAELKKNEINVADFSLTDVAFKISGIFSPIALETLASTAERVASLNMAAFDPAKANFKQLDEFYTDALSVAGRMKSNNVDAAYLISQRGGFESPMVQVITQLVDEANAINNTLYNLSPINVEAKLKEFANNLGLKGKQFEVKSDKVNITINLDVKMQADELVKVLSKHGIVSTEKSS